jgi:hypothetical protein
LFLFTLLIQVQEVSDTEFPHLGELFGATEEKLCSYLIQAGLLHKSRGTVRKELWDRLVLALLVKTQTGKYPTRSNILPETSKVRLVFEQSRAGLTKASSQTSQYYLTLSDPNATDSKDGREVCLLPRTISLWTELATTTLPVPQLDDLVVRYEKKYAVLGNSRPRVEKIKLVAGVKEKVAYHFFCKRGKLNFFSEKGKVDKAEAAKNLSAIQFARSDTKDLRLLLTFNLGKSVALVCILVHCTAYY